MLMTTIEKGVPFSDTQDCIAFVDWLLADLNLIKVRYFYKNKKQYFRPSGLKID